MKQLFFSYLKGDEIPPLAIAPTSVATAESCFLLGFPFNETHLCAEKMAALAAFCAERLGFCSVMPYFGVVQEAAAFGADINWGSGSSMPSIRGHVFGSPDTVKIPENFLDRPPVKTILDSIKILKKIFAGEKLIIGKVMGPWTLSLHLTGMENFLVSTIEDPEAACHCLDMFLKVTVLFAEAQFEAGADAVTLADHATRDLVSPQTYKDLLMPRHKKINGKFFDGAFILHCCGSTTDRMEAFCEAGFKVFHFDSVNDVGEAIKKAGDMKLTGCVNNIDVLLNGTEYDVENQVRGLVGSGIKLISPECAVPLAVKNKMLKKLTDTVKLTF
ncbi:MAG: methyltransferase [Defluviitaleaceae bacterium]|nr:methyltransferase [Defluviitaleaceae bacterium]